MSNSIISCGLHGDKCPLIEEHTKRVEIELPFWGFYESLHDSLIDDAIRQYFMDDNGDVPEGVEDTIWDTDVDYDAIQKEYCEKFVYEMASELSYPGKYSVDLEFADLTSPRFYDYSSDRLFVTIPSDQLALIREEVEGYDQGERWRNRVKEQFTSYDGFSSNYPSGIEAEEWTREEWDQCQYMPLMDLYLKEHIGEDWQTDLLDDIAVNEFASVDTAVDKIYETIKAKENDNE